MIRIHLHVTILLGIAFLCTLDGIYGHMNMIVWHQRYKEERKFLHATNNLY